MVKMQSPKNNLEIVFSWNTVIVSLIRLITKTGEKLILISLQHNTKQR